MRAAVYHRVSTIDQVPELARQELEQAARARGAEIVLNVEETGSGARNDRPGLQRVMEEAKRGRVDAVLVWKLDRWGRSVLDVLHNVEALQGYGVRFIAVTQGLDIKPSGDPVSKLILTVLGGVAEFERSLIIERTRLGLARAKRRGVKLGKRPARDAPDPEQVRDLRAQRTSWAAIGKQLHCTPSSARRAAARLAGKGVPVQVGDPCEKA